MEEKGGQCEWHLLKLGASGPPALQGSCGERRVGAGARGAIVKAGPIRRRVRLRTMQKRCPDPCDAITLVRKRTLPYAVESTISNLAELRCLAQVSAILL